MNLFRKPLLFTVFMLLVMPGSGFAQYYFQVDPLLSYFRDAQRYDLGGSYILPFATFQGVSRVYGPNYVGDTTAKRALTGTGYGASLGLSLPFKATGHISCWAMAVHLMVNEYTWQDLNKTYSVDGSYAVSAPSLNASTIQIMLPIGIDYKIGTDAILSKRLAWGTSLGVGFIPQFNMTSLEGVSGVDGHNSFGCTPYAKIEAAFRLGFCFKLRAMYTMGDITLLNVDHAVTNLTDGPFKINSNANLMLSFIVMPFSLGWGETDWYNTHDTYNQHDRLN